MSDTKPISDPVGAKKPSKDYPWWLENIDHKITSEVSVSLQTCIWNPSAHTTQVRQLLESYSGVPHKDVRNHIYTIREKAWNIRPYPCTGIGAFLEPSIHKQPSYSDIIARLQAGCKLLDIGCFMGQDLRRLVLDGAPQASLIGNDIMNHWDLGYEFFKDKDKFDVPYIESDLLFPTDKLKRLHGQIDVISIVHVLHQWDWDTQVLACKELVKLSKPGSLVVGFQGGTSDYAKRAQSNREAGQAEFVLHDAETFERMWNIVSDQTNTEWKTEAVVLPLSELEYREEEVAYLGSDFAFVRFAVARIR
ncbi:hypothetical protein EK21DRAFT_55990 [Setomelanomma holmii]|uniref:Methyltransferase domain-containing protein n=1 Tax=Setomelanomma holmii TaxID=210430 RepID=A0A9P4LRQ8_9PLEO|nr:hypothetical protein EK21DRAFT_55990 [Setomelanomma holmii]